jgi:hypothetical protein
MSLTGRIARLTGVYDFVQERYVQRILIPFATSGQIFLEEARFLAELTRETRGDRPIIEIGNLFGCATKVLLLNKDPQQPAIAVVLFCWNPAQLTQTQHHLVTELGLYTFAGHTSGLSIVRADKNEFYRTYNGPSPALVFFDAAHTYEETRKDIEWAKASGASIICGHDYVPDWPGVIKAVDEAGGVSEICGGLWCLTCKFPDLGFAPAKGPVRTADIRRPFPIDASATSTSEMAECHSPLGVNRLVWPYCTLA